MAAARRSAVARRIAAVVVVLWLVVSGCSSGGARALVSLPAPKSGEVTFYLSLPGSTSGLGQAVAQVATPGSSQYRHFSSLQQAARQYGASDAQINAVAKSIKSLGLAFAADPTRLFGRVTGSTQQWQQALGAPLTSQPATASSPFTTYSLPSELPAGLQPQGTSLLLPQALVYDPAAEGGRPPSGNRPTSSSAASSATTTSGAQPWPSNTGTPLAASCASPLLQQRRVYTPSRSRPPTASMRCARTALGCR
jgi:Pro-kumamolisin, activation domain